MGGAGLCYFAVGRVEYAFAKFVQCGAVNHDGDGLFKSNGDSRTEQHPIRPVVTLEANIPIEICTGTAGDPHILK